MSSAPILQKPAKAPLLEPVPTVFNPEGPRYLEGPPNDLLDLKSR